MRTLWRRRQKEAAGQRLQGQRRGQVGGEACAATTWSEQEEERRQRRASCKQLDGSRSEQHGGEQQHAWLYMAPIKLSHRRIAAN